MTGSSQKSGLIITLTIILSFVSSAYAGTKVYLLAGQSNMVGWSDSSGLPPELQQPRPDIQTYWQGIWQDLQPGLGGNSSKFGPEVTFGHDIADVQSGENIVLIKYAVSGTSLWNDWRATDGVEYINFINAVDDALLSVSDPEIAGLVWMQGESDAYPLHSTLAYAEAYEQNLTTFIQAVRSEFGVPDMPFVIGQISDSSVWTWGDIVQQAQLTVSQTIQNTALVVTSDLGLKADEMHYNSQGTVQLGRRFANVMHNLEFAASSASSSSDDATLSWLHAIGSDDDRILVVGAVGKDNDPCDLVVSSITYNGVDMNPVEQAGKLVYTDPMYVKTELYYLPDSNLPLSGSHMVEITYDGNVSEKSAGAITLNNVEQQPAESVAANSAQDANAIFTDIAILTDETVVVDVVGCDNSGSFTINKDDYQVERFDTSSDQSTAAGSTKRVPAAGTTTMSWSFGNSSSAMAHSVAAFATVERVISGYVVEPNNAPIEGAALSDGSETLDITDANGYYEVPVPYAWTGTVTAAKAECIFKPSERTYNNITNSLAGQNYEDISVCDLNNDRSIDYSDLSVICEHWLYTGVDVEGDLNANDIVDFLDFAVFATAW